MRGDATCLSTWSNPISAQISSPLSTTSSTGSCAVPARNAALSAPTLVPTITRGRSPRSSSAGRSTDRAPSSYAPRAPPPANTRPTGSFTACASATAQPYPQRRPRTGCDRGSRQGDRSSERSPISRRGLGSRPVGELPSGCSRLEDDHLLGSRRRQAGRLQRLLERGEPCHRLDLRVPELEGAEQSLLDVARAAHRNPSPHQRHDGHVSLLDHFLGDDFVALEHGDDRLEIANHDIDALCRAAALHPQRAAMSRYIRGVEVAKNLKFTCSPSLACAP